MLQRTNSGNWAKQVVNRYTKSLGTYLTKTEAESVKGVLEVQELKAVGKVASRHNVPEGTTVYLAIGKGKTRAIMVHASKEECERVGRKPGPMNS